MHDIRQRSLWMVNGLLPTLVADGYSFVTLDELPEYEQVPDASAARRSGRGARRRIYTGGAGAVVQFLSNVAMRSRRCADADSCMLDARSASGRN